ncbi:diguanylate cyclase [Pseudomonas sp.]|uniref:diguanylate cyclase n=1 Tax=Pseudomonas sp. TaxID=306 RepID=UPI003D0B7330
MPSVSNRRFPAPGFLSELPTPWLLALGSAVVGLLLTALVASVTQRLNEQALQERFEAAAEIRASSIQTSFDGHARDLDGVRRFFVSSDEVTRLDFQRYGEALLQQALAVSWVPRVPAAQRDAFEQRVQGEDLGDFAIRERGENGALVEAVQRAEYFPVLYNVSRSGRAFALGFDLASHAGRVQALQRARANGFMAATDILQLIGPDDGNRRGVLLVAPVYASAQVPEEPALRSSTLRGFVMTVVSVRQMLEGGQHSDGLELEVLDESATDDSPVFYRTVEMQPHAPLAVTRTLYLADRSYRLTVHPSDAFVAANRMSGVAVIVTAGVLLSLMLSALLFSLAGQRQRAQALVDTRTAELRAREQQLAAAEQRWSFALDSSGDGVWDWDMQTDTVYFSSTWKRMLGYADAEVGDGIGEWEERIHPMDRSGSLEALQQHLLGVTEFYRCEHRMRRQDGSWCWVLARGKVVERLADGQPSRVIGTYSDITWRKAAELELARAHGQLHGLLDAATQVSIIATDVDGLILTFNVGAERMLGYTAQEMIGRRTPECLHRRDEVEARQIELTRRYGRPVIGFEALVAAAAEEHRHEEREWTYVRRDGSELTVNLICTGVRDEQGQLIGFLGIASDITERTRILEVLAARDRLLEKLSAQVPGAIYQYQVSADGHASFPYVSAGIRDIYELDPTLLRVDGAPVLERIHPEDVERVVLSIRQSAERVSVWRDEYRVLLPQRGLRWVRGEAVPERQADGAVLWHGYLTDVTGPKLVEQELRELSVTDVLTGIYNRRFFQDRLEVELARVRRTDGSLAVIMLDIDHFKSINDRFGHEAGDRVLKNVCQRIGQRLRRADLFCRLGGEEFIVLCPDTSTEQAEALAEVLRQALREEPVEGVGRVTASFGVAVWRAGESSDDLLRRADAGVYRAKQEGRDRVRGEPA